jgi:hypothetical protein
VFGSRQAGWHPDLPDACAEPFIPMLWIQVPELLGRVPKGSTARLREDGTLPPGTMPAATAAADGGLLATEEDGELHDPATAAKPG